MVIWILIVSSWGVSFRAVLEDVLGRLLAGVAGMVVSLPGSASLHPAATMARVAVSAAVISARDAVSAGIGGFLSRCAVRG